MQNSTNWSRLLQNASDLYIDNGVGGSAGNIIFRNSSSTVERARITSGGDLLVGTTSISGLYNGTSGSNGFAVSGSGVLIQKGDDANIYLSKPSGYTNSNLLYFYVNNTVVGSVGTTGTITVYNTTSDYRLKTVIGPVADAGQRIDALQPVEYTWNSNGERTRGFLAHQFQEVYASSVSGTKDAVDAEGKPVYQAMQASTSEVIADLVAELQSLRKRLAAAGI